MLNHQNGPTTIDHFWIHLTLSKHVNKVILLSYLFYLFKTTEWVGIKQTEGEKSEGNKCETKGNR